MARAPSPDRRGGVYLFDSREDAERLYDAAWRTDIRERLGGEPSIK